LGTRAGRGGKESIGKRKGGGGGGGQVKRCSNQKGGELSADLLFGKEKPIDFISQRKKGQKVSGEGRGKRGGPLIIQIYKPANKHSADATKKQRGRYG